MPEHADMNTSPTCKNDLACHDQGECLRPTPETDEQELHEPYLVNELPFCVVRIDFARRLERQRNEAREAFVIATDQLVRVQGELREARNSVILLQMDLDVASCLADELAESRTEAANWKQLYAEAVERGNLFQSQRDEARVEIARLQMELDASCNAEELRQVREENARLREWHGLTDADLRLRLGEITAQEIRTVRAVLNAITGKQNTN